MSQIFVEKPLATRPPQLARDLKWIDVTLLPPLPLLECGVDLVVVDGAQRHGELIADLERNAPRLGVANMMCMRRSAAANNAWLLGDKAEMLL